MAEVLVSAVELLRVVVVLVVVLVVDRLLDSVGGVVLLPSGHGHIQGAQIDSDATHGTDTTPNNNVRQITTQKTFKFKKKKKRWQQHKNVGDTLIEQLGVDRLMNQRSKAFFFKKKKTKT